MLNHLKVVELASVLAGPAVGQFFAELGAEVIKVENLNTGGDVTRSWKSKDENTDDRSAYFCCCNWGKKSVALDLNAQSGKQIVHQLIKEADIVIASYKPGDAEKLGVSYAQVKQLNAKLIYGQITGYGSVDQRVGYDAVIQAESGFMDLNGEKNGEPLKMPVALIDVLAAHHLKEGLLLALLHRQQTGEGSLVEVSLLQAALSSLSNQATNWLVGNKVPVRSGSLHPNIAPYGESFLSKDHKKILLAIGSDRQFADLLKILKLEEYFVDERFQSNQTRVLHREELAHVIAAAIAQRNASELMKHLHQKKIPAGIIQNVKEALAMKPALELILEANGLRGVKNFVATINEKWPGHRLLPPPHFGEHTQEIIQSLGAYRQVKEN
jgi:crotonobetainyl-CoA:carnitine CoA-transferase CaiB-like acyl-CoA transferase